MIKHDHILVSQYLENISRKALEKYSRILRKYLRGRHGIYALYHKDKLYYVGLASNLRSRLGHHLRDRHAHAWDRFSIYFTIGGKHLKEIESLLLRIIELKGNKQMGKFGRADDLRNRFRSELKRSWQSELGDLFCTDTAHEEPTTDRKSSRLRKKYGKVPVLAKYVNRRFHIRYRYKGKVYIAHVRRDGSITFAREGAEADRLQGKVFTSPSLAAKAVASKSRSRNGWVCWEYERAPGDWVFLNEIRK